MSGDDIERLKAAMKEDRIVWNPHHSEAREVRLIGPPPPEIPPEPSECAYFYNSDYVALYNTPIHHFVRTKPI